jgi:hypothetical protein
MEVGSLQEVTAAKKVFNKIKSIPRIVDNKITDIVKWKADNDAAEDVMYHNGVGAWHDKRIAYRDTYNDSYKKYQKQWKDDMRQEDREWKEYLKEKKKKDIKQIRDKYKRDVKGQVEPWKWF